MKKKYNPPFIEKNDVGMTNKFGFTSVVDYQDKIENVLISSITEEYGSPVMIFSENAIRNKYREMKTALEKYYPNSEISWSYKTNYLQAICSIFHQEGAKAEVVSIMEYDMARGLGQKGSDIIFNGPGKRREDLLKAVSEGARIHIDHLDEIVLLESVSEELGMMPQVAIRVNMDTGVYPQWQRFGFNYDNGEAMRTLQRIVTGGKLKIVGLHTHIGTFMLEATAYYYSAKALLDLAQQLKDKFGIVVEYIDLGGGFASRNTLHNQYTPGEFASPNPEQYFASIGRAFNEAQFTREEHPRLIMETGRVLVAEAGYCVASVIGKKDLPTGQRAVILDAGVNMLITAWWYNLKIKPAQPLSGTSRNTVFYGPLCMNIDVIKPDSVFPDLQNNDKVVIHPVGAYNVTQWMQFIEYRPNVVLISETGTVELIREREYLDDIQRRERIPEHLRV
ncbi:MAG: alanine racemase [Candidatus Cloacimonetes bacterium]|nr:alanine racemase [Candidatus Cloacimonadota bacterium]